MCCVVAGGPVAPGDALRARLRGVHEEDGHRGGAPVRRAAGVGAGGWVRLGLSVYRPAEGADVSRSFAFMCPSFPVVNSVLSASLIFGSSYQRGYLIAEYMYVSVFLYPRETQPERRKHTVPEW